MLVKHHQPVLFKPHLLSTTLGEATVSMTDIVQPNANDNRVQDLAMLLSIVSSIYLLMRK